jgi:hypothetical protein
MRVDRKAISLNLAVQKKTRRPDLTMKIVESMKEIQEIGPKT